MMDTWKSWKNRYEIIKSLPMTQRGLLLNVAVIAHFQWFYSFFSYHLQIHFSVDVKYYFISFYSFWKIEQKSVFCLVCISIYNRGELSTWFLFFQLDNKNCIWTSETRKMIRKWMKRNWKLKCQFLPSRDTKRS
jgi:hypothetical protein